jgi:hypothetical protein
MGTAVCHSDVLAVAWKLWFWLLTTAHALAFLTVGDKKGLTESGATKALDTSTDARHRARMVEENILMMATSFVCVCVFLFFQLSSRERGSFIFRQMIKKIHW